MRTHARAILFGLAVAIVAAAGLSARQSNVRAAVEAANKQFSAAFAKGDAAAIATFYTSTAMAFPPNSDAVRGRDAIQKFWKGVIDSGVKSAVVTTVDVESHGPDAAHEVGTYEMRGDGGKVLDRGKYVVIWKRDQGQWKLHRDIWNTNMPAK